METETGYDFCFVCFVVFVFVLCFDLPDCVWLIFYAAFAAFFMWGRGLFLLNNFGRGNGWL